MLLARGLCRTPSGHDRRRLSCRDQCPAGGVAEFEIEIRHLQAAVGIPRSTRTNVKQPASGFRQHFSAIHKLKLEFFTCSSGSRQYHGDNIISLPSQLRPSQRWIMDELDRLAIKGYAVNLQESRQLKHQGASASAAHLTLYGRL